MKKAFLIFLVLIYSMSAFGVSLKEFYCCGKLESISVTFAGAKKDKCSKDDNTDLCCKTKFHVLKVKDTHVAPADLSLPFKYCTEQLPLATSYDELHFNFSEVKITNGSHAPPVKKAVPIYIYNCVFRV
jgi:hypothetical protein